MADQANIGWLRDRLQLSRAIEATDPKELVAWPGAAAHRKFRSRPS